MWMWKRLPTQTQVTAQCTHVSTPTTALRRGRVNPPNVGLKINKTEIKINILLLLAVGYMVPTRFLNAPMTQ